MQRFSDPPITQCELCQGRVKKLISQSTFHLKGTGWYVTDYASKSKSSERPKSASETKSSEKKVKDSKDKPKEKNS
jgi:predicted nucleic acid-binding Zn ribbon protein